MGPRTRSALVVFSRVRRTPGKLAMLGCFYRGTPRCRLVTTNSLLNVTLRRKASFPINGISFVSVCPVAFQRFLRTLKRSGLLGLLSGES